MAKKNKKYITIYRYLYSKDTTIGELYLDSLGKFCYTLEDTVRPYAIKVDEHTAIPENYEGYSVSTRYSPGFKRDMLILYTEPDKETLTYGGISFKYVYTHGGNTHVNTLGCILVAKNVNVSNMTIQGTMEEKLYDIVKDWMDKGFEVVIRVINKPYNNAN